MSDNKKINMKKNKIIISIVVLLIVSTVSFYIGTKVGNLRNNVRGNFTTQGFNNGSGGMMRGNRPSGVNVISGEVINKDANSVTIKLRDGGSRIVFVSTSTIVQKMSSGNISDITVGNQISASGISNADGSINALSLQQRPEGSPQALVGPQNEVRQGR